MIEAIQPVGLFIGVDQGGFVDERIETASVLAHQTDFESFMRRFAVDDGIVNRLDPFDVFLSQRAWWFLDRNQFLRTETDHLAKSRIGISHNALKIARAHTDSQRVFIGFAKAYGRKPAPAARRRWICPRMTHRLTSTAAASAMISVVISVCAILLSRP